MNKKLFSAAAFLTLLAAVPFKAYAGTLRGSPASMEEQHEIAVDEDLTFAKKQSQVETLVDSGVLVPVKSNADFSLSDVSFPYARPEILLFIERLSAQYHTDMGTRLVVTSLVRPTELQPRNAHKLSVHPAGMAVDFRVPAMAAQRAWLEKALLGLENMNVLDVTREKHPPHYHVAVFPAEYLAYAKKKIAQEPPVIEAAAAGDAAVEAPASAAAAATSMSPDSSRDTASSAWMSLMILSLAAAAVAAVIKQLRVA